MYSKKEDFGSLVAQLINYEHFSHKYNTTRKRIKHEYGWCMFLLHVWQSHAPPHIQMNSIKANGFQ